MKILFIILCAIGIFLLLFICSTCVVASKCSKLEEKMNKRKEE